MKFAKPLKFDKPLIAYNMNKNGGLPSPTGPPPSLHPIRDSLKSKRIISVVVFILIVNVVYIFSGEVVTYGESHTPKDRLVSVYKEWKDTTKLFNKLDKLIKFEKPLPMNPFVDVPRIPVAESVVEPIVAPSVPVVSYIRIKEVIIKATTVLGLAAEECYKLGPTADPRAYQRELESFIRSSFPLADSDETNPSSLINAMRAYFPLPAGQVSSRFGKKANRVRYETIPQKIFQTAASQSARDVQSDKVASWSRINPGWNVTFHDDSRSDEWVRERFGMEKGSSEEARSVVGAWNLLATPRVMRSDFWRYLVIASEGGYYSDTDVEALKPANTWGDDPSWQGVLPEGYYPPSFIGGVETDVGSRADWQKWWIRPVQLSQWTFASARGHPILIDAIRRVVQSAYPGPLATQVRVIEKTGPGVFTDAVFRFLKIKYDRTWDQYRSLGEDGWRYRNEENKKWGDIKILQITGFSPGAGAHMGAGEAHERHAMVKHWFAGSWKGLNDGAE